MIYILVAGGPEELIPPFSILKKEYEEAEWIGVDRGVYHLLKNGIEPAFAFGDFDSLTAEESSWIQRQNVNLQVFPREKDETDMEIALNWALKQKPSRIILAGATGGRLDHMFMNSQLMFKGVREGISVIIQDRLNKMTVLGPGRYNLNKSAYKYVSFLPVGNKVTGLTLDEGFRYPLQNRTVSSGSSLCISNELMKEQAAMSFLTGYVYFIQSRDQSS